LPFSFSLLGLLVAGMESMLDGRAAACGEEKVGFSEGIAGFRIPHSALVALGNVCFLRRDRPVRCNTKFGRALLEIGLRSVFVNLEVGGWQ